MKNNSKNLPYQTEYGQTKIEVRLEEETFWLSQVQMAELFQTKKQNISLHIKNVFEEGELGEISTVKDYLTVQTDGRHDVSKATATRDLTELIDKFILLERKGEVGAGTVYKLIGSKGS